MKRRLRELFFKRRLKSRQRCTAAWFEVFFFGSAKRVQTGYDKLSVVAKLKRERETTSSMACVHKYAMWKYIYGTMEIDCLIFFSFQKDVWILFDKLQRERLGHVRPISTATIARLQSRRNEMCVVFSLNIQWMYGDHIYARLRSSKTRLGGKMKQFFDSLPISDRAAACWGGELRALSQSRDLNLCVWCYQSASGESSPWMWNKKKTKQSERTAKKPQRHDDERESRDELSSSPIAGSKKFHSRIVLVCRFVMQTALFFTYFINAVREK